MYRELNIEGGNPEIIKKESVFMTEIDLQQLIDNYRQMPKYQPINPYAVIKLDKTFILRTGHRPVPTDLTYEIIKTKAEKSKLLQKIEVLSLFENKLTLRFYYSSPDRNINEEEVKRELDKI